MGWGEARPVPVETAADRLADAVRAWRDHPSTGNGEALAAAVDAYDRAKEHERRAGIGDGTGRRSGW